MSPDDEQRNTGRPVNAGRRLQVKLSRAMKTVPTPLVQVPNQTVIVAQTP